MSQSNVPASVAAPDENTLPQSNGGGDLAAGGDAHDVIGDGSFQTSSAIVGLTSSIDEYVHIGREQVMQVFEEALGDVVVLQVECDINSMLFAASVVPPHNESILDIGQEDQVSMPACGAFEVALKSTEATRWAEKTGGATGNQKQLYAQVRSFLGDFFDHDKELNAVVAQTTSADPRALVLLDDDKIKSELADLKTTAPGDATYDATTLAPLRRDCFATNLLSCRQVAQVLEAFAAMGVGSANSRVQRYNAGTAETPDMKYKYALHAGDSIIGETKVFDSDAVATTKQYSQVIKVQITQSLDGASDQSTSAAPASTFEGQDGTGTMNDTQP